jgi:transposase
LVSVLDEEDHVVAEKRVPNDLAKIIGLIEPCRAELAGVVVESTFNWYWLVDGLKDAGFTVHLANTTAIKKYDGLKHSGDEADARYLAHLLRLGINPDQPYIAAFEIPKIKNLKFVMPEVYRDKPVLVSQAGAKAG